MIGKKILVVGATGSGKSTLAQKLSCALQIPHIELDDLHWDRNWTSSPHFEARVSTAIQTHDCWIMDGNYSKVFSSLIYPEVDTIVWLDYSIWINYWRLWCRCWRRWWYQIPLWRSRNIDNLWTHLTSPTDSLFVWLWKTHPKIHERYNNLRQIDKDNKRKRPGWIQLTSPKETDQWLKDIVRNHLPNKKED